MPEWEEFGTALRVTFFPHPETIEQNLLEEKLPETLSPRQEEILEILATGEKMSVEDIASRLNQPPAARTIREELAKLRNANLVILTGKGRASKWFRHQK